MRMQILRVKKLSCKILKTKICVPFEVQYTSYIGNLVREANLGTVVILIVERFSLHSG